MTRVGSVPARASALVASSASPTAVVDARGIAFRPASEPLRRHADRAKRAREGFCRGGKATHAQ